MARSLGACCLLAVVLLAALSVAPAQAWPTSSQTASRQTLRYLSRHLLTGCTDGHTLCGADCLNLQTDTAHCGACDAPTCLATDDCIGGQCVARCNADTDCPNVETVCDTTIGAPTAGHCVVDTRPDVVARRSLAAAPKAAKHG